MMRITNADFVIILIFGVVLGYLLNELYQETIVIAISL